MHIDGSWATSIYRFLHNKATANLANFNPYYKQKNGGCRSRNSLCAGQQLSKSVRSGPPCDGMWMRSSNGKYGLTPQLEIWQKVGGSNCRTCEGQIKEFSKQVGWNMSWQVSPIPGEFPAQYPTVASVSWQSYVDSDKSITPV